MLNLAPEQIRPPKWATNRVITSLRLHQGKKRKRICWCPSIVDPLRPVQVVWNQFTESWPQLASTSSCWDPGACLLSYKYSPQKCWDEHPQPSSPERLVGRPSEPREVIPSAAAKVNNRRVRRGERVLLRFSVSHRGGGRSRSPTRRSFGGQQELLTSLGRLAR